jgi:hypothetical protein
MRLDLGMWLFPYRRYNHGQATNHETTERHIPIASGKEKYSKDEIRPSRQEEVKRFREMLDITVVSHMLTSSFCR